MVDRAIASNVPFRRSTGEAPIRTFVCPRCRTKSGVNIIYGMPGPELIDRSARGEIVLGGCTMGEDMPDRRCRHCGHEWQVARRSDPLGGQSLTGHAIGNALALVLDAASFAADRHRQQRRKDIDASPYINHPLALARILAVEGGISDPQVIAAALLHDVVEDTETSQAEIEARFGALVAKIVAEVTDDKSKTKAERKRLQVEKAASKSPEAKLVKLADKISNLRDILASPPADWPQQRKAEYFAWAKHVVSGLRGVSPQLEAAFDAIHAQGTELFGLAPTSGSDSSASKAPKPNKGHTFVVEDGSVVADYYHFGPDVDYEFAEQIRFDAGSQERLAELLGLGQPVSPEAIAEALRALFGTYYATRDFADENGVSYEARRDMWP